MLQVRHLKMASQYLAHRFRDLYPYDVEINLLNACNLRCVYCTCPDVKIRLLSTHQWLEIIDRLAQVGTMRIRFQGGEPTLRQDFRELCAGGKKAGVTMGVTTNGLEVVRQPELLDYLDEAVFSLDSVKPEIHDRLRGAGTHAQVVKAIDIAREHAVRTFVTMVVNRDNVSELEPLLHFCENRGVRMHAQPVIFGHQYFDDNARHLALTEEQTRAVHRRLAEWKRQGRGLMFTAETYEGVVRWPDYNVLATRVDGESPCMAGKYHIHIEANGDVHPCVMHSSSLTPKNIIRDGFEEALRHVQRHDCGNCFTACLVERKAVFGLRPSALLEVLRRD